jgi:hypothetical protein
MITAAKTPTKEILSHRGHLVVLDTRPVMSFRPGPLLLSVAADYCIRGELFSLDILRYLRNNKQNS